MKIVIVLDRKLAVGILANTAAALAMSAAQSIPGIVGRDVQDADQNVHPGLLTKPIPVLGASKIGLCDLRTQAMLCEDVRVVSFSDVAQMSKTYDAYAQTLAGTRARDINYLGLCIFGEPSSIAKLTGALPLLK